ncbi:Plasmodium exported protein, unknown function [Plasmodium sp. gorilla clade G2]|uniref:Plasmodium exported protein, unknown function n=1 Tax=Plasmodium sp. gorilla clade G2 TaxID=880535 RepID=UPI000D21D20A|nr:Plasmodium exported protein, unknown function [Plasmodium sp. gorilla clade G2]SOV15279.1 Plasmodium exported protein, unknown function [Plasmodium sp. gorilla clade G2]
MTKYSNLHMDTIFYRNIKCIFVLFGIFLPFLNLKNISKEYMNISNKKYFILKCFSVFLFICFLNNLKESKTTQYLNRRSIHNGELEIYIHRLLCEVEILGNYHNSPVYEDLSEGIESDEEEIDNDNTPLFNKFDVKDFRNTPYRFGNIHKKKNRFLKCLTSLDRRVELEIMYIMKSNNESNYFMLKKEPKMRKIKRYFEKYKVLSPILIGIIIAIIIVCKSANGTLALIPIGLVIVYIIYLWKKYKKCKYISDSFATYTVPNIFE